MAKHTGRHVAKRASWLSGTAVCLVVALSGFLLSTNVRINRTVVLSSDTADLVEQRVERAEELQRDVAKLSSQIDTLNKTLTDDGGTTDSETAGSSTMLSAVQGPGVTVTLNDSPLWENMVDNSGSATNINDYVIHQEDIESVMNALWAGGAESMMIQDQRVLFNSAVICQGNVLLLQGKKYSPPYTISAIGPADGMMQALENSSAMKIFQEYVSAFGIGYKVEQKDNLQFPETAALLQSLQYSSVDDTAQETDAQ
ncbi:MULTISPECIES: DUF881 domain-containing protein [Bifidobacterium]|uniref:DUF881 domain-containing protein n=1 Tax=Bifidobacterium TaxID=1678 RepID=UPI001BDD0EE4|nr:MULTISPECIES: DUF881 domain-containing protein [Bifidobacterium]MBT1162243.1 DUF881 domain-containing protein [Bifidobacterium sp. SO1]MBW3079154.1 DUF881 domain-containing protein [Bifidobacterium simiiventris]